MTRTIRLVAFLGGLIAPALLATACNGDRAAGPLTPSATPAAKAAPTAAAAAPTSLLGTWVSVNKVSTTAITALPALSSCGSFQLNITSQTATAATGQFSAVCPGDLLVSGTITAQLGGSTIPLIFSGTARQGSDQCAFTLNGNGVPIGPDMYRVTYTGTSCLGPVQGTETLRLASTAATPPTPTPAPTTPTTPTTSPTSDGLDQVTILNSPANLGSWPITTTITAIELRPSGVHVEFSKKDGAGRWPDWTPPGWDGALQYTLGMALNINGRWYASAVIEFWHGLDQAGGPPSQYAMNWFYDPVRWAPMTYHQPQPGERIGFFVAAGDLRNRADGSGSPVKERSNVVLVTMPTDAGARFTF